MGDRILLTGEILQQKWNQFADLVGIAEEDRLSLSNGWLQHFKARNGLKEVKRHGEAVSANTHNRGLSDRKHSSVKGKKHRLTYLFTSNADGSEKLLPFVIRKAVWPRAFNKKTGTQLGFYYRNNAKAWMMAHLYQDWINDWDRDLQQQGCKIMLLQDNFSGHIVLPGLQNIQVENFEPNLITHIQPKDQGIIWCFKAHYRKEFIQRAINQYDRGITPANIYDIDQLEAMQIADLAWHEVDTTTIRNCCQKAGILPEIEPPTPQPTIPISSLLDASSFHPDPIVQAERQVEEALDNLVATGALQKNNRMDIESLLNPEGESHIMMESTDMEIYQDIMDARAASENLKINGGNDLDEGAPVEPQPSRFLRLSTEGYGLRESWSCIVVTLCQGHGNEVMSSHLVSLPSSSTSTIAIHPHHCYPFGGTMALSTRARWLWGVWGGYCMYNGLQGR
ncbi:uncharacterized protein LACBIDRAFT_334411 [Laccaria bicolor S238N-H82]|uniref:Predicted protein n=1 Tax=Laccaria bicolor (strain S238N-H82 / ATCC MYA-4686) TaxID=486041 RepID=B0DZ47_LACBS|nr:uncharacterized protein LACBIDRAFT_334411 [Laccaria bicolor S238N-H82]EDR00128.1 predicted protein [Laccaria bicolor S238N-H82]|eukprot:XP_001889185.1 predicted protein [Laccaria bicolor S238N-H82]